MQKWAIRGLLLVLLTYGLFYHAYRFNVPWAGTNDFAAYYPMYLHPLRLNAPAPYIYRQVNALLVHGVWKLGIYYPNEIQFRDPRYDQRVFFAALLVNYLALIATCCVVTATIEQRLQKESLLLPLVGAALCVLSFLTITAVIGGLDEGAGWLLTAILYEMYDRQQDIWFCVLMVASIFVRETIPLVFASIAVLDRRDVRLAGWSLLCAAAYLVIRKWLVAAPGHSEQLSPLAMLTALADFRITRAFLFQTILSQNILATYLGGEFLLHLRGRRLSPTLMPLAVTFGILLVLAVAASVGHNSGRIAGVLTPIIAVNAALDLIELEGFCLRSVSGAERSAA